MSKEVAAQFVALCMHTRTNAHLLHLKSRSYAKHMALNGFYDDLIPLVDSFAETYIGEYGMIENYPPKFTPVNDPVKMVEDFIEWIESKRKSICDSSTCQNIIDEVLSLAYGTKYKLVTLK